MNLLDYIIEFKRTHDGVAPSQAEIAQATGIHKTRVRVYLARLEEDNKIHVGHGYRNIAVIGSKWVPPKGWTNATTS